MTAPDRAELRYAIGRMAAYFIVFCLGVTFALVLVVAGAITCT